MSCSLSAQTEEALANAPRHVKDLPFAYAVDLPRLVETVKTLLEPANRRPVKSQSA